VIVGRGSPAIPEVDGASFEERILPLHFIMSHRVLVRALERAGKTLKDLRHLVYPNTTALDRTSVARSLGIGVEQLSGPGPRLLGHAFASDLVLNFPELPTNPGHAWCAALLAVGSGFNWGASIVG
jgi:hypothetical protein